MREAVDQRGAIDLQLVRTHTTAGQVEQAGQCLVTANEMAAWLIALMDDRFISASSARAIWTPENLNNGADGRWAAG